MPVPHRLPPARLAGAAAVVAGGAAISLTRPFTWWADGVVAAFLIVAAAGLAARLRRRRATPDEPAPLGPGALAWAAVAVAAAGWELWNYVQAPRHAHPTLSSLLDTLDATHEGKAVAAGLWLALGWYLVRR